MDKRRLKEPILNNNAKRFKFCLKTVQKSFRIINFRTLLVSSLFELPS